VSEMDAANGAVSLLRQREFMKFWIGQTISVFGSEITGLALPLTAVTILNATAGQMGLLNALQTLPFLLVGLFAGVWADRLKRRPILMVADFGRAILIGSIPAALVLGVLSLEYLFVVTFLVGVLTVFYDVSDQSFLPALVGREHLVDANSKFEISSSAAHILGPGLAGWLIQVLSAPIAITFDALSFLISSLLLASIHKEEVVEKTEGQRPNMLSEIREGLGVVFGSRMLRSIAGCTATSNLFGGIWGSIFILYLTRDLNLEPAAIGFIFAAGAPGALLGAVVAQRLAKRFGVGATIVGAAAMSGVAGMLIPLASGTPLMIAVILVVSGLIFGLCNVVYNVNQVSLRQAITPNRLLGRMNASMRFLVWGTIPIGALIGGWLGETIGLRPTLFVGAFGGLFTFLWVYLSPVRTLRETPAHTE
jgi:MFS family permease